MKTILIIIGLIIFMIIITILTPTKNLEKFFATSKICEKTYCSADPRYYCTEYCGGIDNHWSDYNFPPTEETANQQIFN